MRSLRRLRMQLVQLADDVGQFQAFLLTRAVAPPGQADRPLRHRLREGHDLQVAHRAGGVRWPFPAPASRPCRAPPSAAASSGWSRRSLPSPPASRCRKRPAPARAGSGLPRAASAAPAPGFRAAPAGRRRRGLRPAQPERSGRRTAPPSPAPAASSGMAAMKASSRRSAVSSTSAGVTASRSSSCRSGKRARMLGQDVRQQIGRDGRDDAKPEAAFHRLTAPARRLSRCSRSSASTLLDARLQRQRLVGHPHRLAAAFEQPAVQPFLHFGDLRRQRRLADAGEFGRAAEMQRVRQRLEIFHLPDGEPDHKEKLSE